MKELIGTGVALVTPFTTEGEVDVHGLQNVVTFQIENGLSGGVRDHRRKCYPYQG